VRQWIGPEPGVVGACPVIVSAPALDNVRAAGNRSQGMSPVRAAVKFRLIASVVALALAVALAACASGPERAGTPRTTGSQLTGIVGFRWQITEIRHGPRTVTIPRGRGAYFALTTDGTLVADDTVNYHSGRFTPTADGYHVTTMATTLVGYSSHDPVTLAVIDGTLALTDQGTDVAVHLAGDRLGLSAGTYRITAVRVGPEPVPSTPSPTDTRS
jgi:hypothetical protein